MNEDAMADQPMVNPKQRTDPRTLRPASTWQDNLGWGLRDIILRLGIGPDEIYEVKPRPEGPVPTHSVVEQHAFVAPYAFAPILLQWIAYYYGEQRWSTAKAFFIYEFAFIIYAGQMIRHLHMLMLRYGTFDQENRPRDLLDDKNAYKTASAVLVYILLRCAGPISFFFEPNEMPHFDLWSPVRISAYLLALDYFFYCYHRSCHQVPWLWHIHRKHHSTKHPSPLLSILGDDIQETLEIAVIPSLSQLVVMLPFHELYVAMCYLLFVEAMGHTGARSDMGHPLFFWLKPLGLGLCIEDHDLHHRNGYRMRGLNMGKQTRLFDTLFGTCGKRLETSDHGLFKDGTLFG
ncbi:uncharacterized protein L969DRAFT_22779 [Mixia osmundae IAM 14324]|uniref:Fatty acid hydroxylase domain-containing protein n=1 Tax=Mixia osmundae (strain CBS 9802 / IAM 14324 / JCM 22182 / KY 12970) TaxID=764103 RepID=G7E5A8_MIXOS|nr:uncharacterized protein L969DRAFT_22779 [Mixia osmundae IAM 14324]KEI40832.1 hypothetical protein L969DRAFT_22779 [Mixia osmundae IAM 14324]GAA98018.1 hypothetical protein E5Q_04698 [Mixia osmundae IAM 14324]